MLYIKVQNKKNTPKSHLAFFHLVIHILYFPPQPTADFLLYKCTIIKSVFSRLTLVVFQFFFFTISNSSGYLYLCVCVCVCVVCVCVYVNVYSHISR